LARKAFVELCAEAQASDDSVGVRLLTDIQQIFEAQNVDRLSSADLATNLAAIETSPWGEWSHGKPLSAAKLARLLRPYGVVPHSIRIGDKTPKGYEREDFLDSFRRYLRTVDNPSPSFPRSQSATEQQGNSGGSLRESSKRNTTTDVAAEECENSNKNAAGCGVAPSSAPEETGEMEEEI
jgi:hypothetical protein